jgi:hypothetical protein
VYQAIKEKEIKALFISFGVLFVAGIFAIGANATNLLATAEYANFSTRGKSDLSFNSDGSKVVGNSTLSHDYITEYSYGIAESFNLIAPRLFGGSNNEAVGTDSAMYDFMIGKGVPEAQAADFVSGMPTYWGDQPIVAAPAYIGIIVFFLLIIALIADKRKIKYVFLSGAIAALLLSWGKNFAFLTDFFINTVPLYDKFRAVSSIQVILELCFPVLAIMGLQSFFKLDTEAQLKTLKISGATVLGIILGLFLMKSSFSFASVHDSYFRDSYGFEFVDALKSDRKSLYSADLLRSAFLSLLVAAAFWLYIKNKLSQNVTIVIIGLLMVFDLFFVDKKYVSAKDFVSRSQVEVPFQETPADAKILQDTTHYRVFEIAGNLSSARTSYFHKSIGGYSAVKPRKMQELFDYQIAKNNVEVLNMLNVKYIIQTDSTGNSFPIENTEANGNAWFVRSIKLVNKVDDEMRALDKLNTKNTAVFNVHIYGAKLKNARLKRDWGTEGAIDLEVYKPNYLKYTSDNPKKGLAVFSEMYYEKGWNAYIDGKKTDHFPVDYVLRALEVPAGKHTIEFKFEPKVVETGSIITLISAAGMLLLIAGGIYIERKKRMAK